jgi:ArsR family transcriptional regulator
MLPAIQKLEADLFRALSHPARVRVLEFLADGERTVGEIRTLLAADSGGASHHLSSLRNQGLVESRKKGTSVLYRIPDARTTEVLGLARQLIRARLTEGQELLAELTADTRRRRRGAA